MTDIQTQGLPYETPIEGANEAYANIPSSTGTQFMAALRQSSVPQAAASVAEQGQFAGASTFSKALYTSLATDEAGNYLGGAPEAGSVQTPMLAPKEYNERYAPIGPDGNQVSIGSEPMPEGVAKLVGKAKSDEIEREGILRRASASNSWLANFGVESAAFLADPLNAASVFIPGFGEESTVARLGGGFAARIGGRVVGGATGGVLSQAPLTAAKYGLGQQEASDYDARAAMNDLFMAGATNAIFHAGLGTAADAYRSWRGIAPAAPISADAQATILAPAPAKYGAMKSAVAQIADGRPVDVRPFFPQAETAIGLVPRGEFKPQIEGLPQAAPRPEELAPQSPFLRDYAEQQQQLYRSGYAPGMTAEQLGVFDRDMFEPKEAETEAGQAPKPTTPKATGPDGKPMSPEESELADLEAKHAAAGGSFTAEEQAILQGTEQNMQRATGREAGFQQAAACIAGGATQAVAEA